MHKPLRGTVLDPTHPLARGLVGAWVMNEGSGDRLFDCSGHQSDGALNNMDPLTDWVGGLRGLALRFVGSTSQHVVAPATGAFRFPLDDFTLEAIARWDGTSAWMALSGIDDAGSIPYGVYEFMRRNDNGVVMLRICNTTGASIDALTPASMVADRWHHVVGVFDGQGQLYLDGQPGTKSGALTGSRAVASGPLRIAAEDGYGAPAFYWCGDIGLFRIWDRALSAEEVGSLFREPYGMFDRVTPLWAFATVAPPPPYGPTLFRDRTSQILFADASQRTAFHDASPRTEFSGSVS